MQRSSHKLLAIVAVGGALGAGGAATAVAADAAASPSHGTVHVWATPTKGAVDPIVLTGVIGDHGTATTTDKNGTVDANGTYVKVALTQGTFVVNVTAFHHALNKLQPKVNSSTCSAWGTGFGNGTLSSGTGAYAGISGTVRLSTSFAATFPRFTSGAKKGRCDLKGAPSAQFEGAIEGSGHITL